MNTRNTRILFLLILGFVHSAAYAGEFSVRIDSPADNAVVPLTGIELTAVATSATGEESECVTFDWTDSENGDWGTGNVTGMQSSLNYNPPGYIYGTKTTLYVNATDVDSGATDFDLIDVVVPLIHTNAPDNCLSFYGGIIYTPHHQGGGETALTATVQPAPNGDMTYTWDKEGSAINITPDPDGIHCDVISTDKSSAAGDQSVYITGSDGSPAAGISITVHYPTSTSVTNVLYIEEGENFLAYDIFFYYKFCKGWNTEYTMKVANQLSGFMPNSTPIYESFGPPTLSLWGASSLFSTWAEWDLANNDGTWVDQYDIKPTLYRIPQPVWQSDPGASERMFSVKQYYAAAARAEAGGITIDTHILTMFKGNALQTPAP